MDKDKDGPKELLHASGCPSDKEFIPECEVIEFEKADSLDTLYDSCKKNPGHHNFIPVDQLRAEDLPPEYRTSEMMKEIFRSCVLTVRVKVLYTSEKRPDAFCDNLTPYPYHQHKGKAKAIRYGTGTIAEVLYYQPIVGKPCPCPVCESSKKPETVFWWVCVRTATHVIYDRTEARRAEFDCFFHSDDREEVKTLYGFDTFNIVTKHDDHYRNDACHVWCVTHDHQTVAILNHMNPSKKFIHAQDVQKSYLQSRTIISHPHGCSKRITFGNVLHLTVPVGLDYPVNTPIYFSNGAKYRKPMEMKSYEKENHTDQCFKTTDIVSPKPKCISMDSLLQELEKSPEYTNNLAIGNLKPLENVETVSAHNYSRDSYMVDFYFLFIKHCSLMHLFSTVVEERRKDGWGETSTEKADRDIFRLFLNKEYQVSEQEDTDNTASLSTQDKCLQHWLELLKGSGDYFVEDESRRDLHRSAFSEMFDLLRQEKFLQLLGLMETELHACQCYVMELVGTMKLKCTMKFSELERAENVFISHTIVKNGKYDAHDDNNNDDDDNDTSDDQTDTDGDENLEKDSESDDERDNEEEEKGGEEEEIPEDSTFTLLANAEYAFRVYSGRPGWIHFHPGTVMTLPDGSQTDIGESVFEFHEQSVSLYRGFITYDTDTCPGSSGAAVKFDVMNNFSRTYFPHSGSQTGRN